MKRIPFLVFPLALFTVCWLGLARLEASVTPIFDSLGGTAYGSTEITNANFAAQAFTTGSNNYQFNEITFSIASFSNNPQIQVNLWNTNPNPNFSNEPGTRIAPSPLYSTTVTQITNSLLAIDIPTVSLSPSTKYWISLGVINGGAISWNYDLFSPGESVIGTPGISGTTTLSYGDNHYNSSFQVQVVNTVPEPASVALAFLGIGAMALLRRLKLA